MLPDTEEQLTENGRVLPYQNDPEFPEVVQEDGCYFMSICFHLNRVFGTPVFDYQPLIDLFDAEQHSDDILDDATIKNPQQLCDDVAPGKVRFLGIYAASYEANPNQFEIQCWHRETTNFNHFVAALNGKVVYDPIRGGSLTVKEGQMISKRIYLIQ